MKCFFQFVWQKDGSRSCPFGMSREEFCSRIPALIPEAERSEVLVLVLVDDALAAEWHFSQAPLMTVDSFLNHFGVSANVA